MSKRTDAHRPSAIIPEDYTFVACDYRGGGVESMQYIEDRKIFRAHMERTGGKFAAHFNSGDCHICGARIAYVARFHHTKSNTYIETGTDCAEKMDMGDPLLFKSFRKRIAAGLKTARGKLKAQELLAERELQAAWAIYAADTERRSQDYDGPVSAKIPAQEVIICDIVYKVVRYGSISDAQADYVRNLLTHISMRPQIEAKREAEAAAAAPVPVTDKRVNVLGTVLSTRDEETNYGPVVKMLVQHETGYKLWGSMPSGLKAKRGDMVRFTARIERSPKDDKFGFFSRPTKASVVTLSAID